MREPLVIMRLVFNRFLSSNSQSNHNWHSSRVVSDNAAGVTRVVSDNAAGVTRVVSGLNSGTAC